MVRLSFMSIIPAIYPSESVNIEKLSLRAGSSRTHGSGSTPKFWAFSCLAPALLIYQTPGSSKADWAVYGAAWLKN